MKKGRILLCAMLCAMQLAGCANTPTAQTEETEEKWALIPMVMVDGELYLDTGYTSDVARCGMMDREITSSVDVSEKPTEDDQSNFGSGYGYQYGFTDGTIELYMNDAWCIFATEDVRQELQFGESEE